MQPADWEMPLGRLRASWTFPTGPETCWGAREPAIRQFDSSGWRRTRTLAGPSRSRRDGGFAASRPAPLRSHELRGGHQRTTRSRGLNLSITPSGTPVAGGPPRPMSPSNEGRPRRGVRRQRPRTAALLPCRPHRRRLRDSRTIPTQVPNRVLTKSRALLRPRTGCVDLGGAPWPTGRYRHSRRRGHPGTRQVVGPPTACSAGSTRAGWPRWCPAALACHSAGTR